MNCGLKFVILSLLCLIICDVESFRSTPSKVHLHKRRSSLKASTDIFEGIRAPAEGYVGIWTPYFKEIAPSLPEALVHWGHGGAMLTVLLAMGGIGSFLGWQIRLGNGEESYSFTLNKSAREMHPIIMSLATFFFLLGGQGGLVLLATQGKGILHSDHALTAFLGLSLLAVQVTITMLVLFNGMCSIIATLPLPSSRNKIRNIFACLVEMILFPSTKTYTAPNHTASVLIIYTSVKLSKCTLIIYNYRPCFRDSLEKAELQEAHMRI